MGTVSTEKSEDGVLPHHWFLLEPEDAGGGAGLSPGLLQALWELRVKVTKKLKIIEHYLDTVM